MIRGNKGALYNKSYQVTDSSNNFSGSRSFNVNKSRSISDKYVDLRDKRRPAQVKNPVNDEIILRETKTKLDKNIHNERAQRYQGYAKSVGKGIVYSNDKFSNAAKTLGKTIGIKDGKKDIAKRSHAIQRLFGAVGVGSSGTGGYRGRGRPEGSGKYQRIYGVGVMEFKKLQNQRKALYQQYAQREQEQLAAKGFTPEQSQQLQLMQLQQQNSQVVQQPITPMPQRVPQQSTPGQNYQETFSQPDEDLKFQKFLTETTVTPNTQRILDDVRRIQLKAQMDDLNQQRIQKERRIVANSLDLMKTRNLFASDSNKFQNLLGDDGHIITNAPSLFFNNPNQMNIMRTNRPSILNTGEVSNNLKFWG